MTLTDISPVVSFVALIVSLITAWFTIFRRGAIRSTHPSFVSFSYDFVGDKAPWAKIFVRALLFSTGKRGHVVESLFVRLREGPRTAEFSFWGYGDKDLVRGGGLFNSGIRGSHESSLQPNQPRTRFPVLVRHVHIGTRRQARGPVVSGSLVSYRARHAGQPIRLDKRARVGGLLQLVGGARPLRSLSRNEVGHGSPPSDSRGG